MILNRRHFVKNFCVACLGAPFIGTLGSSCSSTHYVTGTLEQTGISVAHAEFNMTPDTAPTFRQYIIVKNDKLVYPICLYRFSEMEYSALLMKCTHQGTELQAAGDHLHCPAHGSEFNSAGKVTLGPAEEHLRTFRVVATPDKLLIELN